MKAVFVLFVLACTMAVVCGDLICGSKFCEKKTCDISVSSSSCRQPSEYRAKHSGMCACCPACVTLLGENAACKTYNKELGETPAAVCREPLRCQRGVCTKIPSRVRA